MWCLNFRPRPLIDGAVHFKKPGKALKPGERFSLLSWNIQYSAGRDYHFWYDGGKDVRVKKRDVYRNLEKISKIIEREQPDILILQEVDRNSTRTHRIDQLPPILKAAEMNSWSSTTYHRSRFVPSPPKTPLGGVDMHMAIASKFMIASSARYALPGLNENFIRRDFNIKRALQETKIPIENGKPPLVVMNTHLSAFSYGDGTLTKQISVIETRLNELNNAGSPWILGGDFNMIPPGEDPYHLGDESIYYGDRKNPLEGMFTRWKPDVRPDKYKKNPEHYFTYLKYGETRADRKIDYVFSNKYIDIHEFRVIQKSDPPSDHFPLLMEASVGWT